MGEQGMHYNMDIGNITSLSTGEIGAVHYSTYDIVVKCGRTWLSEQFL